MQALISHLFLMPRAICFLYGQCGCKTMLFKIKILSSGQWQQQQGKKEKKSFENNEKNRVT